MPLLNTYPLYPLPPLFSSNPTLPQPYSPPTLLSPTTGTLPPLGFRCPVLTLVDEDLLSQRFDAAIFGCGNTDHRLLLPFDALRNAVPDFQVMQLSKPQHNVALPPGVPPAAAAAFSAMRPTNAAPTHSDDGTAATGTPAIGTTATMATAAAAAFPHPPRFMADRMCGRLVRWLRCAGYDCEMLQECAVGTLAARARDEGRVVLTCSRRYAQQLNAVPFYLVLGADVRQQFLEVANHFGLQPTADTFLSRCSKCNTTLEAAPRAELEGVVPQSVLDRIDAFWRCCGCGRVFWQGSTYRNVTTLFADLFGYDPSVHAEEHTATDDGQVDVLEDGDMMGNEQLDVKATGAIEGSDREVPVVTTESPADVPVERLERLELGDTGEPV